MVLNGTLVAALVSGLPEKKYHDSLHIFSSSIVTLHSIFMAPDKSTDTPHGVQNEYSTYELANAINAAITQIQFKGIDAELAIKNEPKEIVQAHTCKDDQLSQFPLPNRAETKGLLKSVLDGNEIRVLADGPYNWGDNDGNYLVSPPTGFYPDLLEAIVEEFSKLSGQDKIPYGQVSIKRVYPGTDKFRWYNLFNGTAHISEPYFILDGFYSGSGKPCNSDVDCLDANLLGNKETCNLNTCYHPNRPRGGMLRASCTTLGTESKFYTKRSSSNNGNENNNNNKNTESSSVSPAAIVFLVLLSLLSVAAIGVIGFLVIREKRGSPLFLP
jgi:hypothetical protein